MALSIQLVIHHHTVERIPKMRPKTKGQPKKLSNFSVHLPEKSHQLDSFLLIGGGEGEGEGTR